MADSNPQSFRERAGEYGLAVVSVGAGLLIYVRTEFALERRNEVGMLLLIVEIALVAGMILSIIGLPRLESFVALFIFTIAAIFLVGLVR